MQAKVVVATLGRPPAGATHWSTRRGAHTSVAALKRVIDAFIAAHNDTPKLFRWTASADDILGRSPALPSARWPPIRPRDFCEKSRMQGTC